MDCIEFCKTMTLVVKMKTEGLACMHAIPTISLSERESARKKGRKRVISGSRSKILGLLIEVEATISLSIVHQDSPHPLETYSQSR